MLDKPSYFLSRRRFNRKQSSKISDKDGTGGHITTTSGILSWEEGAERGNGLSKMQPKHLLSHHSAHSPLTDLYQGQSGWPVHLCG